MRTVTRRSAWPHIAPASAACAQRSRALLQSFRPGPAGGIFAKRTTAQSPILRTNPRSVPNCTLAKRAQGRGTYLRFVGPIRLLALWWKIPFFPCYFSCSAPVIVGKKSRFHGLFCGLQICTPLYRDLQGPPAQHGTSNPGQTNPRCRCVAVWVKR